MDESGDVRGTRHPVATCCLVLLLVPACLVAYFWYDLWHAGHVNEERRRDTSASLVRNAQEDGGATARALGTSTDRGADALTGVVWRHTEAPVIAYDPVRREFTAAVLRSGDYEQETQLLVHGPERVSQCFAFTFTAHGTGRTWTAKVTADDHAPCGAAQQVGFLARLARDRVAGLPADELTAAGIRTALALPKQAYDVADVVRQGRTVTVDVLVRADPRAAQCYRYTRPLEPAADLRETTLVPVATC